MKRALFLHEYRRTRGLLTGLFAQCAVVVAAGTLLMAIPVSLLAVLGAMLAVATVAIFLPLVTFVLAFDYWRSGYGRAGYLTHSLPVKGSTVSGVRLAYGAIVLLAGTLANALFTLPPAFVAASKEAPAGVGALDFIATTLSSAQPPVTAGLLAIGAVIVWTGALGYLTTFYFAASFGSESRFARLDRAGPIVVWLVVYVVMQLAALAGIVLIPLGIDHVDGRFTAISRNWLEVMIQGDQATGLPIGFVPVLLVFVAVLVWRTAHSWNHKVSLR